MRRGRGKNRKERKEKGRNKTARIGKGKKRKGMGDSVKKIRRRLRKKSLGKWNEK